MLKEADLEAPLKLTKKGGVEEIKIDDVGLAKVAVGLNYLCKDQNYKSCQLAIYILLSICIPNVLNELIYLALTQRTDFLDFPAPDRHMP